MVLFVIAVVGLALGLGGLVVALTRTRSSSRVFVHRPDVVNAAVISTAVLVLGAIIAITIPAGATVFLLMIFLLGVGLSTSFRRERLGLNDYAFVQSGRSLVATWHDPRGAEYLASRWTTVVKTGVGFQAVAFAADSPLKVISQDGVEIRVDLSLAYRITPNYTERILPDGRIDPTSTLSYALWRSGNYEGVRDGMAKPALAMAAREVFGQYPALAAVSTDREAIRVAIANLLGQRLPPQGLTLLGVNLGGTFADEAMQKAWLEKALIEIDPALSLAKLEEMRIGSVAMAGTVVVPGSTDLHLTLPLPQT